MIIRISLTGFSLFSASLLFAQRPHILVSSSDKQNILNKIEKQAWAKNIYNELQSKVLPYVNRHQTNPEWILSRYQMNRVPGKRYTRVYADDIGFNLVKWEGDAPYPTVKINTYLRMPTTISGASYKRPALEEVVPNDTSKLMLLYNPETRKKEWIEPQSIVSGINSEINELALNAAIIYWLNGDVKYAKFAADILDQWGKAVYHQEPIIGPCRTGLLSLQTLGDQTAQSLILAYDFLKPFMQQTGYELKWYETVFDKIASTQVFRGFWGSNWYAAESSTMVIAALSLENKEKQDYYLQYFLEKDTVNGLCGQIALPTTVERWLTPDGHWKEPGGYHNYPVDNLLLASLVLEKNGKDIFNRFPALFKASYAMLKYAFPNLTVGAFGDTYRAFQSPESLEIGLVGAVKYNQPELSEMLASMNKLIDGGKYKREQAGYLGLLSFLDELPQTNTTYQWPRTGSMDFARLFLQRNGTDVQTGLMAEVQGATYNHNHCNGMAMELYGLGEVMGIDAGRGVTYQHPLHQNYFIQWAAHNTVVAARKSSSAPFSVSATAKNIGQVELAAMEPMPDSAAVSPNFSFTDNRYLDQSTNTNQSKTLSIVRTGKTSGYYVDIFRSDNPISNDYVYHNIGSDVKFLDSKKLPIITTAINGYPTVGDDYPGFRFFTDVKKLSNFKENITAQFSMKDKDSSDVFMQALIAGETSRDFYLAKSPKTKTAGEIYNDKPLPLFTISTTEEAKSKPFIVVYEPYKGVNGNNVERILVEKRTDADLFTALNVFCKDGSSQQILQSVSPEKTFNSPNYKFSGYYGVASFNYKNLSSLYLGKGNHIALNGYSISSSIPDGSASLEFNNDIFYISCNQATTISIPNKKVKKVLLKDGKSSKELKFSKLKGAVQFEVPIIKGGQIFIQ